MEKTGIFYGSTLGNCQRIAEKIYNAFGQENADLRSIENAKAKDFQNYKNLILGTSTWGVGEMQEDWEKFTKELDKMDLKGKKVALFSIGDQVEWIDSFVNGMGILHHTIAKKTDVVGFTPIEGYNFEISLAIKDNQFVGLVIDEANQPELTDTRINNWVEQLRKEFN